MKTLLMFLSVAILSGCGGGLVTHMNKNSVSIQWNGLISDLESVTKQAQEKCAVFGRKAVFVHDDGVAFLDKEVETLTNHIGNHRDLLNKYMPK